MKYFLTRPNTYDISLQVRNIAKEECHEDSIFKSNIVNEYA